MKTLLLVTISAFAIPFTGAAAPICVSGSLTSFLAQTTGGCMIGGSTVTNASVAFPLITGATAVTPASVTVTPSGTGLQFGVNITSAAKQVQELLVGYTLTAPSIVGASLSMAGFSVTGDGAITSIKNVCSGASFTPATLAGCITNGGTRQNLTAFAVTGISQATDTATLAGNGSINVIDDIVVDGGTMGSATLNGSVTNSFTTGATAVPEPSTMLLLSAGLCGIGLMRRRVAGRFGLKN